MNPANFAQKADGSAADITSGDAGDVKIGGAGRFTGNSGNVPEADMQNGRRRNRNMG